MDISARGIELIKHFEGAYTQLPDGSYKSYLDKLAVPNVWTIYTGLTKGVNKDTLWTKEECEIRLRKELNIYENAIEDLVTVDLNQNMFDALTSFVFNCGVGALKGSTLLKLLNQGKYEQVPAQLMRWVNAGGKRYEGLARRRAAEGALFMEPVAPAVARAGDEETPAMPQRVEAAPVATVKEALTASASVKAAAVAVPGAAYSLFERGYDWLFGIVKEAGPEIVSLKTQLSPFDALLKLTPTVLMLLTLVGLTVVIVRKVASRRSGTSV